MLGLKTMLKVGFVVHFCQKKHVFLKKRAKIELGVTSRALSLYFLGGDLTLL